MAEKFMKPHIVVSTDLALGDDYGAVMALCAYAVINKNPLSFIGTFGDRSAKEAADNLALIVPRLWKQLGQSEETLPDVYIGADRPIGSDVPFEIPNDDISRIIHGEFERTPDDKLAKIEPSKNLVDTLVNSNIPIALLSIGAPTEAAYLTESLGSLIHYNVAMLGAMGAQGNVSPKGEANASRDPTADQKLLELSILHNTPFTLVSLECTQRKEYLVDDNRIQEMEKALGKDSYAFQELMKIVGPESNYGKFYRESTYDQVDFPYEEDIPYGGAVLHDLTGAVALIDHIENKLSLLEYATKRRVWGDEAGGIGKAREYMRPASGPVRVDIAGPPTENYWPTIINLMKYYK